jgi:hypothetical protein
MEAAVEVIKGSGAETPGLAKGMKKPSLLGVATASVNLNESDTEDPAE